MARDTQHPPAPALRLAEAPGGKVRIRAGDTRLADLSPASVVALELREGEPVSAERAALIARRAAFEKAYSIARTALARAPLSAAAIRERLQRRAIDPLVAVDVIDALRTEKLIDDRALADAVARRVLDSGGAGAPLLESKLAARGVDADTARDAARDALEASASSALDAARARASSLPTDLSPPARARRLYAFLARRGFEEHEAADAVERILGVLPGPLD